MTRPGRRRGQRAPTAPWSSRPGSVAGARPLALCAALLSVLGLWCEQARAAALFTVSLTYPGKAGCPDQEHFEDLVSQRLGYGPFSRAAPDRVLVHIEARGAALEGRIEWHDRTGRWAGDQSVPMAGSDCGHLARALAAALAVQIQLLATTTLGGSGSGAAADGAGSPREPTPAPASVSRPSAVTPPEAPPPESASPTPPVPPPPPPAMAAELHATAPSSGAGPRGPGPLFSMGAGTAVGFGLAAGPVMLGRAFGSFAWPRLVLELSAEASLPSTARREDGAGFSEWQLLASVAACARLAKWSACAVGKAGEVRMAGENIDRPTSAVVPVAAAGARIGFAQPLAHDLFVAAHAAGLVNAIRWTATLDRVPVWTAPRFSAEVGIDGGVRFP